MKKNNIVIIDGKEYEVDSSGAKPENYYYGIRWKLNGLLHRVDGAALIRHNGTKRWYQNGLLHNLKGPSIIFSNGDQYWHIKGEFIGSSTEGFTQEKFEEYLLKNHKIVIIDNQEYEVDSSGAKPEKHFNAGICWRLNGEVHRVDGPAIIYNDGNKYWRQNGQNHNLKGPARIYGNGDQYWFIKDKLIGSSTEGFTQENFEEYLLKNHKIVIIDGQDYEVDSSGAKPEKLDNNSICWKLNSKLHRVDGPAVIWYHGDKEWYQNGLRHNLKGPAFIDSNGNQEWFIKDKLIGKSTEGFTQKKFELFNSNSKEDKKSEEFSYSNLIGLFGIIVMADKLNLKFSNPKQRIKNYNSTFTINENDLEIEEDSLLVEKECKNNTT